MQDAKLLLNHFLGQPDGAHTPPTKQPPAGGSGLDLKNFLSGPGGLATGALAGGLAGLLLGGKKPKKIAKSALQVGGVALVGGLAYKAWQNWQANKPPVSTGEVQMELPPQGTPFMPATQAEEEALSKSLIRAMISAAKADGHITPEEQQKIGAQLEALQIGDEHRAFIQAELTKPLDIEAVASAARTPEQGAEIYAASLLAIDPDGAAERGYLAMLAARLKLEPGLIEHLHASADAGSQPVAA